MARMDKGHMHRADDVTQTIPVGNDREAGCAQKVQYSAKRKIRAEDIMHRLGSEITEEDMPRFLPQAQRRTMLAAFPGESWRAITREALALELIPTGDYWKQAGQDLRAVTGRLQQSPENLPRLSRAQSEIYNRAAEHVVDQMLARDRVDGSATSAQAFATLALLPGASLPTADRNLMFAHALLSSRLYNRHCSQFADYVQDMPEELAPHLAQVRRGHREAEVLHHGRRLAAMGEASLGAALLGIQDEAIETARLNSLRAAELAEGTAGKGAVMNDRVRLAAAARMLRQARESGGALTELAKSHKAILGLHPLAASHADHLIAGQVTLDTRLREHQRVARAGKRQGGAR